MAKWGSLVEVERRRRIKLTLWAYAYEVHSVSLIDDHTFDMESRKVNLKLATGRADLDKWWRENFDPSTGMWVLQHPEMEGVKRLFERVCRAMS